MASALAMAQDKGETRGTRAAAQLPLSYSWPAGLRECHEQPARHHLRAAQSGQV
jgi:hypothetical protein